MRLAIYQGLFFGIVEGVRMKLKHGNLFEASLSRR